MIPATTGWLIDPAAQRVCGLIAEGGHKIFFVGGCVRNALMGLADSDIDLATDAPPNEVMALAKAAGIKAVPTGIDHGTVTLVIKGTPFEITTFRRDVATDGRRAVVAFSKDIADDARRRDFTMNALYADAQGRVIDPLNGLPDLRARQVRFIEDADARIREDYLRTLRYFRFCALYGDPQSGFDPDALTAISANIDGLGTLSAERVGQEMQKLLSAPDPAPALAVMRQTGVLPAILSGADDRFIAVLVHLETEMNVGPDWLRRLALLGGSDVAGRLRLSKASARQLALLQDVGFAGPSLPEVAYRHGENVAISAMLLRASLSEQTPKPSELETILRASQARFPVKAADLMGDFYGPALGKQLALIEQRWIASGFTLGRDDLLGRT